MEEGTLPIANSDVRDLHVLAANAGLQLDSEQATAIFAHLREVMAEAAELANLDLTGVEPASVFDAGWPDEPSE